MFRQEIESYLEAGLDGFLGKPVQFDQLQSIITSVYNGHFNKVETSKSVTKVPIASITTLFDHSVLEQDRQTLGNELVYEMVAMFHERSASLVKDIQVYSSTETLERAAHSLKSSAGAVGLIALSKACEELEIACKKGGADEQELEFFTKALLSIYAPSIDKLKVAFQ